MPPEQFPLGMTSEHKFHASDQHFPDLGSAFVRLTILLNQSEALLRSG